MSIDAHVEGAPTPRQRSLQEDLGESSSKERATRVAQNPRSLVLAEAYVKLVQNNTEQEFRIRYLSNARAFLNGAIRTINGFLARRVDVPDATITRIEKVKADLYSLIVQSRAEFVARLETFLNPHNPDFSAETRLSMQKVLTSLGVTPSPNLLEMNQGAIQAYLRDLHTKLCLESSSAIPFSSLRNFKTAEQATR